MTRTTQVGYARVSTTEQETALQVDALRRAGVRRIVLEHRSGATLAKRPKLQELLLTIQPGECLTVYKLDRLARSLRDLLSIIERLSDRGASFRSLTEPIDTTTPAGRLMLSMLGAVAEFERSLIRERSIAGQKAAIQRGAVVGRPSTIDPRAQRRVLAMYATGRYTMQALATAEGVSVSAIKRLLYRSR